MRRVLAAFFFTLAVSLPAGAFALPTIATQWGGWGGANFGHGGVGYATGTVAPNPAYPGTPLTQFAVGLGGDSFVTADKSYDFSSTGSFNTWCVDIRHWMIAGAVTYAVGGSSDLARDFSSQRVDDLLRLADQRYALVDTQTESAAFQQAVWAIMYATPSGGKYRLNSSTYVAPSSNPGAALAQGWLDELDSAPATGEYKITYLYQPPGVPGIVDNTQDMVVFSDPVPEPGTFFLFGGGVLALSGYRLARRRTRA